MILKGFAVPAFLAILLMWMPLKSQESEDWDVLSPGKARAYSILATVVPVAAGLVLVASDADDESGAAGIGSLLFWLGGTFGPGTGYLYAHHPWGFWRGALIRTGGVAAMVAAFVASWDDPNSTGAYVFFIGGSVFYVGSAIIDVVYSGKCAGRYNESHGALSVKIKPCYIANKKAPGLMLSVRF